MTAPDPAASMSGFIQQMRPRALAGDCYAFENGAMGRRMFGGITLGQALVAAAQTATGLAPHELHTLFLRPHLPGDTVRYAVERLRDGRRFSSRRVRALAGDRVLSETTVSFTAGGDGLAYQAAAPPVPPPDGLPDFDTAAPPTEPRAPRRTDFLFEQRLVEWVGPGRDGRNVLTVWARAAGGLPDEPVLRAAALAALSDVSTQVMGLEPWAATRLTEATLNQRLWLHALPPLDGWLLVVRESRIAASGRVLMSGEIYTRDGLRCASLAQESLLAEE